MTRASVESVKSKQVAFGPWSDHFQRSSRARDSKTATHCVFRSIGHCENRWRSTGRRWPTLVASGVMVGRLEPPAQEHLGLRRDGAMNRRKSGATVEPRRVDAKRHSLHEAFPLHHYNLRPPPLFLILVPDRPALRLGPLLVNIQVPRGLVRLHGRRHRADRGTACDASACGGSRRRRACAQRAFLTSAGWGSRRGSARGHGSEEDEGRTGGSVRGLEWPSPSPEYDDNTVKYVCAIRMEKANALHTSRCGRVPTILHHRRLRAYEERNSLRNNIDGLLIASH